MYSELLKVPFLVHLPRFENGGMRTDALVYFHDVLPTILDLMGQGNNTEAMMNIVQLLSQAVMLHQIAAFVTRDGVT